MTPRPGIIDFFRGNRTTENENLIDFSEDAL